MAMAEQGWAVPYQIASQPAGQAQVDMNMYACHSGGMGLGKLLAHKINVC
jgi:hypothetical protein